MFKPFSGILRNFDKKKRQLRKAVFLVRVMGLDLSLRANQLTLMRSLLLAKNVPPAHFLYAHSPLGFKSSLNKKATQRLLSFTLYQILIARNKSIKKKNLNYATCVSRLSTGASNGT